MPMKMMWIWNSKEDWRPKSLYWIPKFSRDLFCSDIAAGVSAGLFALPIAMALGIASGVTPQARIYAIILGGFVVSITGGSNVQISGPSGAFMLLLGDIVATYGIPGLQAVLLMAGLIPALSTAVRAGADSREIERNELAYIVGTIHIFRRDPGGDRR